MQTLRGPTNQRHGIGGLLLVLALAGQIPGCSREHAEAPANPRPESPYVALDRELNGLASAAWESAVANLESLGFRKEPFDDLAAPRVISATRVERNLDEDPNLESLVHIQVKARFRDDYDEARTLVLHLLAWLRADDAGIRPLATRSYRVSSCLIDGELQVEPRPVRSRSFDDIVVRWIDAPVCHGDLDATQGTAILALIPGGLREILDYSDQSSVDRVSHDELDGQLLAQVGPGIPAEVAIVTEEGGHVRYRLGYQPDAGRYRVAADLAVDDARVATRLDSREWSNRCFIHIKAGRYSHALAACNRGIEHLSPESDRLAGALFYNLGLIAQRTGDSPLAASHFRRSLQVRPGNQTVERALQQVASSDE